MTFFSLITFLSISNICSLMDFGYCSLVENSLHILKSRYGEGYGTEWIYFPDDDGNLHYVDLKMTEDETNLIRPTATYSPSGENYANDVIEFRLYNKNDGTYILLDNQGLAVNARQQVIATKILKSNKPLKLITHGWRSSADLKNILNLKNAYFEAQNVNVITVDWSSTAGGIIYPWAATKTKTIGVQVAMFLDALYEEYKVAGDQLHLIGHSLGAHVMGMAASMTDRRVHRVTGLDPAGPFFEIPAKDPSKRLNSSAAEIVDVIHTCGGYLGFQAAIGTVDFYPNEGSPPQPGCGNIFSDLYTGCSHSISYHYFLESIKDPTTYLAYECASWQDFLDHQCKRTGYMGDSVDKTMTGTYYLTTDAPEAFLLKIPDIVVICE